jgi:hypothetical protein
MRSEETALHEAAAIGYTIEEGLCPVPGHVEADGPPERAGAPERGDKNDTDDEDLKEAEFVFAAVVRMGQKKESRGYGGGKPEGDSAGVPPGDGIADANEAPCEGELEIAAKGILLDKADEEEDEELNQAPSEDGAAM